MVPPFVTLEHLPRNNAEDGRIEGKYRQCRKVGPRGGGRPALPYMLEQEHGASRDYGQPDESCNEPEIRYYFQFVIWTNRRLF